MKPESNEAEQVANEIARRLEQRVEPIREEFKARGLNTQLLNGAITAAEVTVEDLGKDPSLFVAAVRDPQGLNSTLTAAGAKYRAQLEEAAEPFYDRLLNGVGEEMAILAPWSPQFRVGALQELLMLGDKTLAETRQIQESVTKLDVHLTGFKEQALLTLGQLSNVIGEQTPDKRPTLPVRLNPRVTVSSNLIERHQLDAVTNGAFQGENKLTVLTGACGTGKTQLAAALVQRCKDDGWPIVAWINSQTREDHVAGLARLGRQMGLSAGQDRSEIGVGWVFRAG